MREMLLTANTDIKFPNLGVEFHDVPTGFTIFGIDIALYGIVIAVGMIMGFLIAEWQAKRSGQDKELYLDFAIYAIIISVIGARLYYVVFNWGEFSSNPLSVFNLRTGGLAIYGGVIAAILTGLIYCKIKKYSFFLLADTGMLGLLLGQIIGRWGNFFNREAFGKYTDGLFSMQLDLRNVSWEYTCSLPVLEQHFAGKTKALENIIEIRNNIVLADGIQYIQVHPTFLYESVWNLVLLIFLVVYWKHKRFDGEIFFLYLAGYGLGRLWIEGLRTDQLFMWGASIPVSQALSAVLLVSAIAFIVIKRVRIKKNK